MFETMDPIQKCVFLDRDGVLNYDSPGYVFEVSEYTLYPETATVLSELKEAGYLLIVITNQAGLSRGIYSREQMNMCHTKLKNETGGIIDDIYYSPYHPSITESLSRKPGTLLFEKAIAKWNIDTSSSWMIGDKQSDLLPANSLGMKTIGIQRSHVIESSDFKISSIEDATGIILAK